MYTIKVPEDLRPAIIDINWFGEPFNSYVITRINVPERARGHGVGSRLLDHICAIADAEQLSLMLAPEPSGGMGYLALVDWYHRRGFEFTESGAMMERQPKERS
ncbi:MAG TPA: GNAT family N-acetyltransferase [Ktedonobacteraceae bacterium]|jgi:GNAT superfamily N-acetyltransferase